MLDVPDKVKTKYKSFDVPGSIYIKIGDTTYSDSDLMTESLTITEALCSKDTLDYSSVEANKAEFELARETGNIKELIDKEVYIYQMVEGTEVPLGTYTVYSTELDGDYYTKVTCYDHTKKFIDTIIDDWWNTELTFPLTLRNLLIKLCDKVGVNYSLPSTWCNSTVQVNRNVFMEDTKASTLLGLIQELSGCFFNVSRKGVLQRITHAAETTSIPYTHLMEDATISDYTTPAIQAVQIRNSDSDIGTSYGAGNTYIIQDNHLVNALQTAELETVCKNILSAIGGSGYVPFEATFKSVPYVECGDSITITSYKGNTATYWISYRVLTGNGLIKDTVTVKGKSDTVTSTKSSSKKVTVLKQRMHEVTNTLDEYSSKFTTVENKLVTINGNVSELKGDVTTLNGTVDTLGKNVSNIGVQVTTNTSSIKQNTNSISTLVSSTSKMNADYYLTDIIKVATSKIVGTGWVVGDMDTLPTPPYKVGDLIIQGEQSGAGRILVCCTARKAGETALRKDWVDSNSYATIETTASKIEQSKDSILLSVSKNYVTNSTYTDGITGAKTYADESSSKALTSAKADTDAKLQNYSTTAQMTSAIKQSADDITLSVSKSYVTIKDAQEAYVGRSTFDMKIGSIETTVSEKVGEDEIISKINQSAESVSIEASKINFTFGNTGQEIKFSSNTSGDGVLIQGKGSLIFRPKYRTSTWVYGESEDENIYYYRREAYETTGTSPAIRKAELAKYDNARGQLTITGTEEGGAALLGAGYSPKYGIVTSFVNINSNSSSAYSIYSNNFLEPGYDTHVDGEVLGKKIGNWIELYSSETSNTLTIRNNNVDGSTKNGELWMNTSNCGLQYTADGPWFYVSKDGIGFNSKTSRIVWGDSENKAHAYNGANNGYIVVSVAVNSGDGMHPIAFGWTGSQLNAYVDNNYVGHVSLS